MAKTEELLRLAATAAGFYIKYPVENPDGDVVGLKIKPYRQAGRNSSVMWNSLTNDGDALCLGARLMMDIVWHAAHGGEDGTRALCCVRVQGHQVVEFYTDDQMAATRLAITRVAAAIEQAKP